MEKSLLIVENPANWPLEVPGLKVVAARDYLIDARFSTLRRAKIFNLCRSYRYQSVGYYVSLLAEARRHKVLPQITTIQDLKSQTIFRTLSDDLDDLVQRSLGPIKSPSFVLSVYFGQNVAKRYGRLSSQLFRLFDVPLLRVEFEKGKRWEIKNISAMAVNDIPEEHRAFVVEAVENYLKRPRPRIQSKSPSRYDLALLWDPTQSMTASNEGAIKRFVKAAETLDIAVEILDRRDYGRLAEFDALFIRDTTAVPHYTYRFARRASAEGLIVIDDPESILRCTNKVFLAELLRHHKLPAPKTVVIGRSNLKDIRRAIDLPCILKQPDSSFSQGVTKVETEEEFREGIEALLDRSELIIAQEFLPTPFDWRVGILNREPLYACRYYMARHHWQIIQNAADGEVKVGKVEAVALEDAPAHVIAMARKAAALIGDGFYGVDLKQIGSKCYVIEVNDNPSVDAGYEDTLLKQELYLKVMSLFRQRLDKRFESK